MTLEAENIFNEDISRINGIEIDDLLKTAKIPCCERYRSLFVDLSQKSKEENDILKEELFKLLLNIVTFAPKYDTPEDPYGPAYQILPDKSSSVPSDLGENDIEAIKEILKITSDSALRARLLDVLWLRTNEPKYMTEATNEYTKAAEMLPVSRDWVYKTNLHHRAIWFATMQGRDKEAFRRASENLQNASRLAAVDPIKLRSIEYLGLINRFHCGIPSEFAKIALDIASRLYEEPRLSRDYLDMAASFFQQAKDVTNSNACKVKSARAYITEAQNRTRYLPAPYTSAASILREGIEALRRAQVRQEEIATARTLLSEYEKKSVDEVQAAKITIPLDIAEEVKNAQAYVAGLSLYSAIIKMTIGYPIVNLKCIEGQVTDNIKQNPFPNLFNTHQINLKGQVTRKEDGLWKYITKRAPLPENVWEEKMFSVAALHWSLRVHQFINPARIQILNEHHPNFNDLWTLIQNNPFVPPGHEMIFLRGIHAGFHGDFLQSSLFLIPQIENSVRYVFELHDVDTSNIDSDGIQTVKSLRALLNLPRSKEIFGEELIFELRGHLLEEAAYGMRYKIAHGIASDDECDNNAAQSIWWLVLRIIVQPINGYFLPKEEFK